MRRVVAILFDDDPGFRASVADGRRVDVTVFGFRWLSKILPCYRLGTTCQAPPQA